jgi:hypothetical protein
MDVEEAPQIRVGIGKPKGEFGNIDRFCCLNTEWLLLDPLLEVILPLIPTRIGGGKHQPFES